MKNFNVEKAVKDNVNFLRRWFNQFEADSIAVIGISGGKDSTIAAALLVKAIGKESPWNYDAKWETDRYRRFRKGMPDV